MRDGNRRPRLSIDSASQLRIEMFDHIWRTNELETELLLEVGDAVNVLYRIKIDRTAPLACGARHTAHAPHTKLLIELDPYQEYGPSTS